MTYLAPRQGLFAIIILVSFCVQSLLLVISTDQQLTKSREQKGEQMIAQLIDEARLSLENKDRVSLSVIANRYTSEQDVARLVIKDGKGEVLVPVGNAPMQQGATISQVATEGDAVIGSVALTLRDISKGEIIALQWPFVIGSLILHFLLWVAYGYIARPTKEQINALSRDIDNLHREHSHHERHSADSNNADPISDERLSTKNAHHRVDTAAVHDDVNAYLRSQQQNNADSQLGTTPATDHTTGNNSVKRTTVDNSVKSEATQDQAASNALFAPNTVKLSAHRDCDHVSVQVMFHDDYRMLERLTPEMRNPYLALCTQLLNQALIELLKQPLLLGVSVINTPRFDENGVSILLKADNKHAKVALAGVMLGKLYLMLNKIIHSKHIELARFALPAKAGVSDQAQAPAMKQLLKTVGRKEQLLILLPSQGLAQTGNYMQVQSVKRPTSVYERECVVFDGGNAEMMERLAEVRNAVLMSGNEIE